ncbi:MAG: zinc ribbon domain-containing protein [bacterium]|nr:zinc ribbon domain-containing protein [bacterium]
MYCTNCGTELVDGAKFCTECRARVEDVQVVPASADHVIDSEAGDVAIAEIVSVESADEVSIKSAPAAKKPKKPKKSKEPKASPGGSLLVFAAILLTAALLSWLAFIALDLSKAISEIGSLFTGMMSVLGAAIFVLAGLVPAFCALVALMQAIKPFIAKSPDTPSSRGVTAWILLCLSAIVLCGCIAFRGASFAGFLLIVRLVAETYLFPSTISIVCSALAIFCLIGARLRRLSAASSRPQSDEEAGNEE